MMDQVRTAHAARAARAAHAARAARAPHDDRTADTAHTGYAAAPKRRPQASLAGRHSRHRRARGQAIAEFALVAPVMMLLLLAAVDFGRLYFAYVAVNNAAREGAAYAEKSPTDNTAILSHARQEMGGDAGLQLVSVRCTTTGCPSSSEIASPAGDRVTVTVRYRFNFLTPFVGNVVGSGGLSLTASSTAVLP